MFLLKIYNKDFLQYLEKAFRPFSFHYGRGKYTLPVDISGRICFVIFRKQNKTKSEPREEAGAKDWLLVVHKSWRENEKTDCILGDNGGENKEKRKN